MTEDQGRWLIFCYAPAALFSLKMPRATSTAGKTLLCPAPYSVRMAFVDVALRHRLTSDADALIRALAQTPLRIGLPEHACVTGTIQSVRQERADTERRKSPDLPLYRSNVAMREFVHYQGYLRIALDTFECQQAIIDVLAQAGAAVNYFGKRGSFVQYVNRGRRAELDSGFTQSADPRYSDHDAGEWCRAELDDFGPGASFDALNSFNVNEIRRGVHRTSVETLIPLAEFNAGPGFVHYRRTGSIL